MQLRKYRWSRDYESAEEELHGHFKHRKINAERWHAEEGHEFELHSHDYDKQLWCAEGSIIVTVYTGQHADQGVGQGSRDISLQPGDALDLPAGTPHSAKAGISGVVCYENRLNRQPPSPSPSR